jgi:membrane associated rhomboid family serine protease
VLPLRDDNPSTGAAWITIAIVALNVIVFLAWEPTFASGPDQTERQEVFFFCQAEIPYEVSHQTSLAQGGAPAREAIDREGLDGAVVQDVMRRSCPHKNWLLSVFQAMFLHESLLHIGGNMLFLWIFGNNVENRIGRARYLLFYFAAGIVATLGQLAAAPNSVIPNLGASGAIAGVLGAYLVMFPRRKVLTLIFLGFFITWVYLPAVVVLGGWFLLQLVSGVGSLSQNINTGGGVAFFAHIGGFLFGAAVALLFFPKEGFTRRPPPARPDMTRRGWLGGRRRPRPDTGWPA